VDDLLANFAKWFSAHANYTWAHNLDEMSNGGIFPYGTENYLLALQQICPQSLRSCNYGSSDYDVRSTFNADFVVHPSYHFGNSFMNYAFGGWEWSGKMFWRGGLPYSVIDGNLEAVSSTVPWTIWPPRLSAATPPDRIIAAKGLPALPAPPPTRV
jgi:hypothetical protein